MAGNKLTAGTNNLLAVIGDEETVVGMLLAGVGNVDGRKSSNFFVVDDASAQLEEAYERRRRRPRKRRGDDGDESRRHRQEQASERELGAEKPRG